MKTINAFVNKENYTSFSCPECEKGYRVNISKYRDKKHTIVARCTCDQKFIINLNFRQFYRKKLNLPGKVVNLSTNSSKWYTMTVVNLSMTGLRFKLAGVKSIEKNHRLQVDFALDDPRGAQINKEVRVIDIRDGHYGCEFLNLAYEEKELGYYLFPI